MLLFCVTEYNWIILGDWEFVVVVAIFTSRTFNRKWNLRDRIRKGSKKSRTRRFKTISRQARRHLPNVLLSVMWNRSTCRRYGRKSTVSFFHWKSFVKSSPPHQIIGNFSKVLFVIGTNIGSVKKCFCDENCSVWWRFLNETATVLLNFFLNFYFYPKWTGFDHQENDNFVKENASRDTDAGAASILRQRTKDENGGSSSLPSLPQASTTVDLDENEPLQCQQCENWRQKYRELNKTHLKLCARYSHQSMKQEDLLEFATGNSVRLSTKESAGNARLNQGDFVGNVQLGTGESASELLSDAEGAGSKTTPAVDNIFTRNEIMHLNSLPLEKKKDSSYVMQCIQYAYSDRPLKHKTLKGTKNRYEVIDGTPIVVREGKSSLTPEKVHQIRQLFIGRISKSKCLAAEFGERIDPKYLNRLIASAVKNVSNKETSGQIKSNPNAGLEL